MHLGEHAHNAILNGTDDRASYRMVCAMTVVGILVQCPWLDLHALLPGSLAFGCYRLCKRSRGPSLV
eukprot:3806826-Amphidinium_carterae.1